MNIYINLYISGVCCYRCGRFSFISTGQGFPVVIFQWWSEVQYSFQRIAEVVFLFIFMSCCSFLNPREAWHRFFCIVLSYVRTQPCTFVILFLTHVKSFKPENDLMYISCTLALLICLPQKCVRERLGLLALFYFLSFLPSFFISFFCASEGQTRRSR